MRPRGESASCPHKRYVGQVGRQKPQCTQSSRRSRSRAGESSAVGFTMWQLYMDRPDSLLVPSSGSDSSFVVGGGFSTLSFIKAALGHSAPPRTRNWNGNSEPMSVQFTATADLR